MIYILYIWYTYIWYLIAIICWETPWIGTHGTIFQWHPTISEVLMPPAHRVRSRPRWDEEFFKVWTKGRFHIPYIYRPYIYHIYTPYIWNIYEHLCQCDFFKSRSCHGKTSQVWWLDRISDVEFSSIRNTEFHMSCVLTRRFAKASQR